MYKVGQDDEELFSGQIRDAGRQNNNRDAFEVKHNIKKLLVKNNVRGNCSMDVTFLISGNKIDLERLDSLMKRILINLVQCEC